MDVTKRVRNEEPERKEDPRQDREYFGDVGGSELSAHREPDDEELDVEESEEADMELGGETPPP